MSCVTTVAGTVTGQPRFILELHTPDDDIRIELCNLQTVAFLRRATNGPSPRTRCTSSTVHSL
jgi:hypothetical protein